jgi:hypothetical protein
MVTLRLCAVVTLLEAGVTFTVGVVGVGGGVVVDPPPQPFKTETTQITPISESTLAFIALTAPGVQLRAAKTAQFE